MSQHKSPLTSLPLSKVATLSILGFLLLALPPSSPATRDPGPDPSTAPDSATEISLPPPVPIPLKDPASIDPTFSAAAAIVIDSDSGTVLYSFNPDLPLHPASTTKIMTTLLALETYPLDQVITIQEEEQTLGQTMNLVRGEQITVRNLIHGALIASGNDAALALAMAYPDGSYLGYVRAMNQKAQSLHLDNTTYKNVSGVDSEGHVTTARDLARLTSQALQNPFFAQIVATKQDTVESVDGRFQHSLTNTNQLLGTLAGVDGVKTGWTESAGECLVTTISRNNHRLITVVLGSTDRFGDTRQLIDWIYQHYTWIYPQQDSLTFSQSQ